MSGRDQPTVNSIAPIVQNGARRRQSLPHVEAPTAPVRDEKGRSYATGKRSDAVARVWIKPGTGKVTVNGKEMDAYFARPVLQMILRQPFEVAGVAGKFDVVATVKGGGISGQAGAVKHGISKALQLYDPGMRPALKAAGFLTRDSRVVGRSKYGKAKLRKPFSFKKGALVNEPKRVMKTSTRQLPEDKQVREDHSPTLTVQQQELHRLASLDRKALRMEMSGWDIDEAASRAAAMLRQLKD